MASEDKNTRFDPRIYSKVVIPPIRLELDERVNQGSITDDQKTDILDRLSMPTSHFSSGRFSMSVDAGVGMIAVYNLASSLPKILAHTPLEVWADESRESRLRKIVRHTAYAFAYSRSLMESLTELRKHGPRGSTFSEDVTDLRDRVRDDFRDVLSQSKDALMQSYASEFSVISRTPGAKGNGFRRPVILEAVEFFPGLQVYCSRSSTTGYTPSVDTLLDFEFKKIQTFTFKYNYYTKNG
jgi:hypothetical protein